MGSTDNSTVKKGTFSKDNIIVEISSKQGQIKKQNVVLPERPKENRKWGDYL